MAAFTPILDILFPTLISYGSSGGPKFRTTVFSADSGYEQRKINWRYTRAEYNVSHGIKTQAQMDELTNFFMVVRGRAYGFRFKDFGDFRINAQVIGKGDGETRSFQLVKTYTFMQPESGQSFVFERKIIKPDWDTVAGVTLDGVVKSSPSDYTVDYSTGLITFTAAPAKNIEIRVGSAEFHVPVRFDTDHLDTVHEFWNTQSWSNIPLVEVRDWTEVPL